MMMAEKALALAVRVNSEPLQLVDAKTSAPIQPPHTYRMLSLPIYLTSEIPRLVGELLAQRP
jgi:hypothetical protein